MSLSFSPLSWKFSSELEKLPTCPSFVWTVMELGQLVHWNVFLKDTAIDLPWGCLRVFFQSLKTEQLQEPLYGEWICWIHFSWYRPAETSWAEGQTFSRKKIWVLAAERAELNYRALTIAWRLKELYLLALCLLGQEYVVYVSKDPFYLWGKVTEAEQSCFSCILRSNCEI